MIVTFDSALDRIVAFVNSQREALLKDAGKIVVVRDIRGRLRLATEFPIDERISVNERLKTALGPYFAGDTLVKAEMLAPEIVFDSNDEAIVGGVSLLERVVSGGEWGRRPLPNADPSPPRATLYGIKGGVGRSTVICAWARFLAERGERVLVIDLDLESPGLSTTLLPDDNRPDFGIVDWLVEEGVGNVGQILTEQMTAKSPIATTTPGDVIVVPCSGNGGGDYIAKLARVYLDSPQSEASTVTFAARISTMIDSLETFIRPSVVLIDSRAGIHDLAGIATTRLGAMTFLFAAGTRQTWEGYRTLLGTWGRKPVIATEVRERLRVVAAQVPETDRDRYLARMKADSYDVFADTLYEEAGPNDIGAFNFDVNASDAPHFPVPVYWSRAIQEWDPLKADVTDDQLKAAFGEFLKAATDLLLDSGESDAPG